MKITKIDEKGLQLIMKYEGFKSKPYLCPAGVPTIGYGTTRYNDGTKVKLTDKPITKEQALELLKHQVKQYELDVDAMAVDSINQNQFNALVSFAYNLGSQALKKSTLLKKVNKNPNDASITKEFLKWVFAGGKKLNGLIRRRNDEAQLYFN